MQGVWAKNVSPNLNSSTNLAVEVSGIVSKRDTSERKSDVFLEVRHIADPVD